MRTEKEIKRIGNYVYYPLSSKEYILETILTMVWDVALVITMICLTIRYSPLWIFLILLGASSDKIARRECS